MMVQGGAGDDFLQNMGEIIYEVGSFRGGDGNDTLIGSNSVETLMGDAGADTLRGRNGDDTLEGGAGNDLLIAGAGNDELFGDTAGVADEPGVGRDVCDGGKNNDTAEGCEVRKNIP